MTKILLVEDDKALREIYGVRLLAEGYDIVSAGDGEEALTTAMNEHPDLIISDIMMPKISGFEMLDLLRTNAKTRDIKVIVMSALGGEPQRQRGKQLGADRYLVKSQVGIEDVVTAVHEVLGDRNPIASAVPNQSPFNPSAATAPSTVTAAPQPSLPDTPPSIPAVMQQAAPAPVPNLEPNQNPAAMPTIKNDESRSLLPNPGQPTQNLPPIPSPSENPANQFENPTVSTPAANTTNPQNQQFYRSESNQVGSARIIQPTGESLSPKIDIGSLLSKEEARETVPDPSEPTPAATNLANIDIPEITPIAPPPNPQPAAAMPSSDLQIDPNGIVNLDSLPEQDARANSIFPAN